MVSISGKRRVNLTLFSLACSAKTCMRLRFKKPLHMLVVHCSHSFNEAAHCSHSFNEAAVAIDPVSAIFVCLSFVDCTGYLCRVRSCAVGALCASLGYPNPKHGTFGSHNILGLATLSLMLVRQDLASISDPNCASDGMLFLMRFFSKRYLRGSMSLVVVW